MSDIYKSKSFNKKSGPSKCPSQQNLLENEIEIKFLGWTVFILLKKNCDFLGEKVAVFQQFNLIAALITIVQLRWNFV